MEQYQAAEAVIMTAALRLFKEPLTNGKKKADAIKAVIENSERLAAGLGEGIATELRGKIEQRASEI
jgi:hypothetical protein